MERRVRGATKDWRVFEKKEKIEIYRSSRFRVRKIHLNNKVNKNIFSQEKEWKRIQRSLRNT
jgi:hypothetical protein